MNHDNPHIPKDNSDQIDRRIDLFLDGFRSDDDVDLERIKMLSRSKIRMEQVRERMKTRRKVFACVAAAAVVACIIGVATWIINPVSSFNVSEASESLLADAGYVTLHVPAGECREISLPDGSVIIANARTVVKYPGEFRGSERRIYADGEVYCCIARDTLRPFVVESRGFDVKVLGTTFNVRNSSDSTANVVLVEGSVEINTDSHECVRMSPDDRVDLHNGNITSMRSVDTSLYTSWINGMLYFKGEPMRSVISRINDYYDLDITCDSALAGVKVYGKLNLKGSHTEVINSIQSIVPMNVERRGRHIILRPIEGV
ncbi:FecR family protein [uncultured Muribaculum sp.]|uniref:FecR family protein n=1 Tax=uncultured Muribaculum sp. TaxID=1918613 RepID=UPI0025E94369|nr:FecR domain-containing protein [uncultured Muribaculum sp.]